MATSAAARRRYFTGRIDTRRVRPCQGEFFGLFKPFLGLFE